MTVKNCVACISDLTISIACIKHSDITYISSIYGTPSSNSLANMRNVKNGAHVWPSKDSRLNVVLYDIFDAWRNNICP